MANRHLSRSLALQALFEWDFRGYGSAEADAALTRDASEFAPGIGDLSFAKELMHGILAKLTALDAIIEKAAPEWPIARIGIVDRNILRLGLYELLFMDRSEVPPKVAINEAIELGKTFGGETSGRFVNGVLGAVYKELGEPGKDDTGAEKKKKNFDPAKAPIENLIGAVVYGEKDGEIFLALLHDIFGHWTLSKGHLKEGESDNDAVIRKVKEELGLGVEVEEEVGNNEYLATDPERGKIKKRVSYYLAKAPYGDLTLGESGGLDDAKWFPLADILELNFYDDVLPILTKGLKILSEKN
ncbi:transcription antitermination factor NusB [bacterium]|nr:transcription antitermination factor NusB [bacterium]